jgi:hypothetical protein
MIPTVLSGPEVQILAGVMSMFECRVNGKKTREGFTGISTAIIKDKRVY